MIPANFDAYAESYERDIESAVSFAGQDSAFFLEVKADILVDVLRKERIDPARARVLDVGCGNGVLDGFLVPRIGELHGVDISVEMVARASRANPGASYTAYMGGRLPFDDGSFDLAFASCVLHHVPLGEQASFLAELHRIVRSGGLVALLEHNPLNPLTRLVVSRCRFDDDAILVSSRQAAAVLAGAGLEFVSCSYTLFFPWRGRSFRATERRLGRLPLGAQYVAYARRPCSSGPLIATSSGRV